MLGRIAITILVVCIHAILIMVGGRILFTGCKLLVSLPAKSKKKSKEIKPELSTEQDDEEEQESISKIETKKSLFKRK